ncbi:BAG family molecular chaperone regulator 1-like [Abrus precatorius]|uniref:BAG family molecular chaperone regulator 1-like n=1 Tax=Abrus precatorius TaxID=3816 RepID=A0A8B8K284_ABRPR|nr:BAG family molecular chaperone regulator 1-like [Abrus precatorius]
MFSRGRSSDIGGAKVAEWELRPGGMVVQKRNSDVNLNSTSSSTIKVKVKYGSSYHEIGISSHASFGELKKMLTGPSGLHAQDQKLIFKKKERDSKSYLDVERVKDGSKLVLLEDIESRERRILEMLRIAKKEKTSKSLSKIKLEVDKLANKVAVLKNVASGGGVASELDIESLTENLMRILITLDEIYGEGELKLQRREQVRRVQKHIETLDKLKMPRANSTPLKNGDNMPWESMVHFGVHMQGRQGNNVVERNPKKQQPHSDSVVVTTYWEAFD